MKLIIDIDEEDFEIMKHNIAVDNPLCSISEKDMVTKIANGIPLDKLKERISLEKLGYTPSAGYHRAIMKVLQIIDNENEVSE